MKKILALFITLTMIMSFAVGAIAGAREDAFADAVLDEQAQLALEKAAIEFAKGNDVEGIAAEEDATNDFGKTQLGFNILAGAVIGGSYAWGEGCGTWFRYHKPDTSL